MNTISQYRATVTMHAQHASQQNICVYLHTCAARSITWYAFVSVPRITCWIRGFIDLFIIKGTRFTFPTWHNCDPPWTPPVTVMHPPHHCRFCVIGAPTKKQQILIVFFLANKRWIFFMQSWCSWACQRGDCLPPPTNSDTCGQLTHSIFELRNLRDTSAEHFHFNH